MAQKILIIDDEPSLIMLLRSRLLRRKYEVVTAADGVEGLEKAKSEKPDLIILDVLMPGLSGYQLVEKLREYEGTGRKTPIIVISARQHMKDFFKMEDILSFLVKPLNAEVLLSQIEEALQPPATKGQGKKVLIIAIEDTLLNQLKDHLESRGCLVVHGTNEARALERAKQLRPDLILGQFCKDSSKLDLAAVFKKLGATPETKSVPFAAFCNQNLAGEAAKCLESYKVLTYIVNNDLFHQVDE